MSESDKQTKSSTSPPDGKTHEATTPPGGGEKNEEAMRIARETVEKAGAGH